MGETIEVTFIESFGRQLGVNFISQDLIKTRNLFSIESGRSLVLLDLFGSGLTKLGVDSRLTSGGDYAVSRAWCEAIYHHPLQVDGIRYFSRHDNTRLCCGLFERSKLQYKAEIEQRTLFVSGQRVVTSNQINNALVEVQQLKMLANGLREELRNDYEQGKAEFRDRR